jgi:hypothetical protein
MMLMTSSKARHIVEKSDHLVRVILPSKRNIFRVLFGCLWFLMWGYMVFGLLYVAISLNKAVEVGKNATPPVQLGEVFWLVGIGFSLFFLVLLGFGVFGMYRFGWILAGKEVIEASPQILRITHQIFQWRRSKEYSSERVSDIRTNTQPLSVFLPGRRVKRFLGGAGMIAFDYGGKTSTFGLEISEAEANEIILALKEKLVQQKAG